jgi:hypothetical protein
MKKLLVVSMCLVGAVAVATAQDVQTVETKTTQTTETVETVAPLTPECGHIEVSHFSFGIKTGVNYFTMSPPAPRLYDKFNLMVGGNIDYTINPMYGFGLEYLYNDYTRPYTYMDVRGLLKGNTHDIVAYSSVNLCNTISPYRTGFWKNLNVYGDVGGGVAFFSYNRDFGQYTSSSAPVVLVKLGLNAEFTLSDYFNLCFEGQYRQYDTRVMGSAFSNRNNEALIATMGLRYKIGYAKLKHARNISLCVYSPRPAPIIVNNTTVVKYAGSFECLRKRKQHVETENATDEGRLHQLQRLECHGHSKRERQEHQCTECLGHTKCKRTKRLGHSECESEATGGQYGRKKPNNTEFCTSTEIDYHGSRHQATRKPKRRQS